MNTDADADADADADTVITAAGAHTHTHIYTSCLFTHCEMTERIVCAFENVYFHMLLSIINSSVLHFSKQKNQHTNRFFFWHSPNQQLSGER